MANMRSPLLSPINTNTNTMDTAAALAEDDDITRLFRKQKQADTSYNFGISLKAKDRSVNKWNAKFDHTLDFLMYPSLHVAEDENYVQQYPDITSPLRGKFSFKATSPTSKNKRGYDKFGASTSPGKSPSNFPGSPGSPSHLLSPVKRHDYNSDSDDSQTKKAKAKEAERNRVDFGMPKLYWEVDIIPSEKLELTLEQKARRDFEKRIIEVGEQHNRDKLRWRYEAERKRQLQQMAEEQRLKSKSTLANTKGRAMGDTALSRVAQAAQGRERSRSRMNFKLDDMNDPNYIYKNLRSAGIKKKVLNSIDIKSDNITDEMMYTQQKYDLEKILGPEDAYDLEGLLYYRFNYDIASEKDKADELEKENLRASTMNPSRNLEKAVQVKNSSQNRTLFQDFLFTIAKEEVSSMRDSSMSTAGKEMRTAQEEALFKKEYDDLMLNNYRGKTQIKSDLSTANLSRLRRAIRHRMSGMDAGFMITQEYIANQSLMKGIDESSILAEGDGDEHLTKDAKEGKAGTHSKSPKKKGKKEAEKGHRRTSVHQRRTGVESEETNKTLLEIREVEKRNFMASMGFDTSDSMHQEAFGLASSAKGIGFDSQSWVSSPTQDLSRKSIGSPSNINNSMAGMYNTSAEAMNRSVVESVSGNTRVSQDALIMRQLAKGIIPETYIRRSDNLDSVDIDISNYSIGDEQGSSLGGALLGLNNLRGLVLSNNRLRNSIAIILANLTTTSLLFLDLSSNNLEGKGSLHLSKYLQAKNNVLCLVLNKCSLKCFDIQTIAKALMSNKETKLKELHVNSNEIQGDGARSISKLISNPECTIENIDLCWNNIKTEGAISLSEALKTAMSLKKLNLDANSIADMGGQQIAASLSENKALVELHMAQNNIKGGSCFVFARTCKSHPKLMKLNIGSNAVGEAGARSIYRQIMRGLSCFVTMTKCSYFEQAGIFAYTTPSLASPYTLDLNEPYKAAVLQELMTLALENPGSCRFGKVTYSESSSAASNSVELFPVVQRGNIYVGGRVWTPPKQGILTVEYISSVSIPSLNKRASAKSIEVLKLIIKYAREQDRLDYFRLVTADLYLTTTQVQSIIQSFMEVQILDTGTLRKLDIIASTWTRLIDTQKVYDFMNANMNKMDQRSLINSVSLEEYKFNWRNPSGHWRLNLESHRQLTVFMKIISFNKLESDYSKNKSGRGDTSQDGNWFNFRNAKLIVAKGRGTTKKAVQIDTEWISNMPRTGVLEFDYVSTSRPGTNKYEDEVEEDDEKEKEEAAKQARDLHRTPSKKEEDVVKEDGDDDNDGNNVDKDDDEVDEGDVDDGSDDGEFGKNEKKSDELNETGEPSSSDGQVQGRDSIIDTSSNEMAVEKSRRQSAVGGSNAKKNPLDKYEVISDRDFFDLMVNLGLSSRAKLNAEQALIPLMELQLASTKYWFTVQQVIAIMDTFEGDARIQSSVVVTMFNRIKDLYNMDVLLRQQDLKVQRQIINRLGCLNVINPLKLALDYKISMKHLDMRILLTELLQISPNEGTDQIREDTRTDVSVLTFYGALHRIVAMTSDDNLLFKYLDFGEAQPVRIAWSMRRDAISNFLVGTKPVDRGMFRTAGMYREMEKKGTLTRGPIELQYAHHLKQMAQQRKAERSASTAAQTVRLLKEKREKDKKGGGGASPIPKDGAEEEESEV